MAERYNSGDPRQTAERRKAQEDERLRNIHELRGLLRIPEFRRYLWRVIGTTCRVLQTPMNSNGSQQSYNIGRGDVGRELWEEIEDADAAAIHEMMRERYASRVVSPKEEVHEQS